MKSAFFRSVMGFFLCLKFAQKNHDARNPDEFGSLSISQKLVKMHRLKLNVIRFHVIGAMNDTCFKI